MNFSHKPVSLLKKNIGNQASQTPDSLLRLQKAGRPTFAGLLSFCPEVKFDIKLSDIKTGVSNHFNMLSNINASKFYHYKPAGQSFSLGLHSPSTEQ